MSVKRIKCARGLTLVEIMATMVILAVVALGALGYQYHAVRHAQIAKAEMTATRTAQLLLEDWKSTGGSADYTPTALELGFSAADPEDEADFSVTVDDLPMYVAMSHRDVAYDSTAGITLREISVMIGWRRDHMRGSREADDPSLVLTTYVRLDAAGG